MEQQNITPHNALSTFEQFERHNVEGSRLIRDNLSNVLRPLVQSRSDTYFIDNGMTLSNWIQGQTAPASNSPSTSAGSDHGSFIINVEDMDGSRVPESNHHTVPLDTSIGPSVSSNSTPSEINNSSLAENGPDLLNSVRLTPEAAVALGILKIYIPFIIILLIKTVYDYTPGILLFAGLTGTFTYHNYRLKKEIASCQVNIGFLLFSVFQIIATICFYYYLYYDMKLYLSLVFIPPYVQPLTVIDLLWLVGGNDYILRLITVVVKVLLTLIPHRLFPAKRRGKWYVAVETTSQLYRSLVPTQPWLYYLLDSYHGPHKVIGVFLCAAYMVSKGADIMARACAWWASVTKLLKSVQLGVTPSKDQLSHAGPSCPICHDPYNNPLLLSCRHIFCEDCVFRWFNSEQTCPMCRARVFDDPTWRDGSTSHFIQLF